MLPLKLTVCTAFEPTVPPTYGGEGRYQIQLQFYGSTKTSGYILQRVHPSCQCHGCGNSCRERSTPICLQTTHTQVRPYVRPRYMGAAPAKTCSQLGDANPREAVLLLLTRLPNRPLPSHQSTQFKTSTSIPVQGYLFLPLLQSLLPLPRFQQISCESGHRKTHYLKRIWLPVKKFTGSFSSTSDNSKSYIVFNMNSTCSVP